MTINHDVAVELRVKNADVYRTSRPMRWSRRVP